MRICLFTPAVGIGAFAGIARSLAAGLDTLDAELDIVYLQGPDPADVRGFPVGAHLVRIGGRSRTCPPALARYLRRRRPAALISLGWILNPAAVVGVAMARTDTPLYLNEQSSLSYKTGVEHRGELRLRALAPLARLLYPRATAVTGASVDVVDDLVHRVGIDSARVPVHVIPNPVDLDRVRSLSRCPDPGEPAPGPVFVNAARHVRQKNLPLLLDAFRRFVDGGGEGTLVLVGDGPETPALKVLARELGLIDRVVFRMHLANPYPAMAAATAFVLSSEEEGFGLVLVEAMALGVPVIATDCPGGPREILRGGQDGLLVPPGDAEALASALRRMAGDARLRESLSSRARERAEEFRPDSVAHRWLDVFAARTGGHDRRSVSQ